MNAALAKYWVPLWHLQDGRERNHKNPCACGLQFKNSGLQTVRSMCTNYPTLTLAEWYC